MLQNKSFSSNCYHVSIYSILNFLCILFKYYYSFPLMKITVYLHIVHLVVFWTFISFCSTSLFWLLLIFNFHLISEIKRAYIVAYQLDVEWLLSQGTARARQSDVLSQKKRKKTQKYYPRHYDKAMENCRKRENGQ